MKTPLHSIHSTVPAFPVLAALLFSTLFTAMVSAATTTNPEPPGFVKNLGQADASARYLLRGRNRVILVRDNGLFIRLEDHEVSPVRTHGVLLEYPGARATSPRAEDRARTRVSHFRGRPEAWIRGAPVHRRLVREDLWPGIDLAWTAKGGEVEYAITVRPGAAPGRIRLRYSGGTGARIGEAGELVIETPLGNIEDGAPRAFQIKDGVRRDVPVRYAPDGGANAAGRDAFTFGFEVGDYDPGLPLVIDPVILLYSGFLGGTGRDIIFDVATDREGYAYVTGSSGFYQCNFPVKVGPGLVHKGYLDAFVAKITPDGSELVYCGFIGGDQVERGYDIALDDRGRVYVGGYTDSPDTSFPVVKGPDLTWNGDYDAFLARVSPDGTSLEYCGYIGGKNREYGNGIDVDENYCAYLGGQTNSDETSFPVLNGPGLKYKNSWDGFVAKVSADGSNLEYCGYISGQGFDWIEDLAVDSKGRACVVGGTDSMPGDLPLKKGPVLTYGGGQYDAITARVNARGTHLDFCGYIGGTGWDVGYGIAVDGQDHLFVTGATDSAGPVFPCRVGPDRTYNGGYRDAFIAKVDAATATLRYCGYIGGDNHDYGHAVDVDSKGRAYVAGSTASTEATFPVIGGPDLTQNNKNDAYIAVIRPDGQCVETCGYIGGWGDDSANGIAVDSTRTLAEGIWGAYVAGTTHEWSNVTFPVKIGPFLTHAGGYDDGFVSRVGFRTLITEDRFLSPSGGQIRLDLAAGPEHRGRTYLIMGSLTGTHHGIRPPGGIAVLPLKWDAFTTLCLTLQGTPYFPGGVGKLDQDGNAQAIFDTQGPFYGGAGCTMYFAYALAGPWDFSSNAVGVGIK